MADITADPPVGYSGDLMTDSEISYCNNMCQGAYNVQFGTMLDEILTASQDYTIVDTVSDADKNTLNGICEAFHRGTIGTNLQNAAVIVNSMAEYDESEMLTFAINGITGATGTIGASTIAVTVPYGTAVTALVANFVSSAGSTVTISSTEQESGVTANNFTSPVIYRVTSQTGDAHTDYTVTITIAENTEAQLLTFAIGAVSGTIDEENKTVAIEIPFGENPSAQVATFTVSDNAVVTVATVVQESGVTSNDYTNPVTYVVTSEDESTVNEYVVTVTVAAE